MKSNIYYVLGNPQCSKGWIAIINSWLYDGLTDDNDINYKAQYWPSLVQSYDEMIKKVQADDQKFDLWSTDGFNQWQPRNVGAIVMFMVCMEYCVNSHTSNMIKLDAIIYSNIGTVYNGHSCALVDGYGTW